MSAQYDFSSGLDLSALTSVTQAQLMQAINQLAPLSNIGGIIYGDTEPDVINNLRFARYVWIDTSTTPYVLKTYDAPNWVESTVGAGAINSASQFDDNLIPIAKLLESEATGRQILRKNASNTAFEYTNPANILTTGEVALSWLSIGGASAGDFLRYTAVSGIAWSSYDPTADVTNLPVNRLLTGTSGYILRIDPATGLPTWTNNDDSASNFLAAGGASSGINVSKLAGSGSVSGDLLKSNGTNWVSDNPMFNLFESSAYVDCSVAMNTTGVTVVAHGLSAKPKMVVLIARCTSNDVASGFDSGDFIMPDMFGNNAAAEAGNGYVSCWWDATNINFYVSTSVDRVRSATTGALTAPTSLGNFTLRAYCLT